VHIISEVIVKISCKTLNLNVSSNKFASQEES
jgi:hypothetical protein